MLQSSSAREFNNANNDDGFYCYRTRRSSSNWIDGWLAGASLDETTPLARVLPRGSLDSCTPHRLPCNASTDAPSLRQQIPPQPSALQEAFEKVLLDSHSGGNTAAMANIEGQCVPLRRNTNACSGTLSKRLHLRVYPLLALLIVFLFLLVNLINLGDYGISYDERAGIQRGEETARIIAGEFSGDSQNIQLVGLYMYHPGFYAFLDYETAQALEYFSVAPIPAIHVLNVLMATAGLAILYLLSSRMFNRRIGMLSVLMLALFPRYIANSQYNGKDVPVMVFSVLTFYLLYRAIKLARSFFWIAAGVAFGMSITTKLDSLIILPTFLLACLAAKIYQGRSLPIRILQLVMFIWTSLISVILLWPALWVDPHLIFRALHYFTGEFNVFELYYLGKVYSNDHLPWHYTPLHIVASTPVIVLVFGLIGLIVLTRRYLLKQKVMESSLLFFWIFLPILPRLLGLLLQYGGMRHVFIVMPPLAIVEATGFDFCISKISATYKRTFSGFAFAIACVCWLLFQCEQVHPYEGSYVNELARALTPSKKLAEYFDFYSWCTSMKDDIQWLNKNASVGSRIKVLPIQGVSGLASYYPIRKDLIVNGPGKADFVIELREIPGGHPIGEKPVFSVKCYDTILSDVYRGDVPVPEEDN